MLSIEQVSKKTIVVSRVLVFLLILIFSFSQVVFAASIKQENNNRANKSSKYLTHKEIEQKTFEILKEAPKRSLELLRLYIEELNATKFENLLNSNFLINDPKLIKSKAILAKTRAVAKKYEYLSIDKFKNDILAKLEKLNFSPKDRKDFMQGFHSTYRDDHARKNWKLENLIIDELEKIVYFLHKNRDNWQANEDGEVVFLSEKLLEKYNLHIEKIGNFAKEQNKLKNISIEKIGEFSEEIAEDFKQALEAKK